MVIVSAWVIWTVGVVCCVGCRDVEFGTYGVVAQLMDLMYTFTASQHTSAQNGTNKNERKVADMSTLSSHLCPSPSPSHTLASRGVQRFGRAGAKGMVCFLMTQAITKLSWQVILRQINASRFSTKRGLGVPA